MFCTYLIWKKKIILRKEDFLFGGLVHNSYPDRLMYKSLGELYNLRKNKNNLSETEYTTAVRNIITKMKIAPENDILTEVKQKTAALTQRLEARVEVEQQKVEKIEEISKRLSFLIA